MHLFLCGFAHLFIFFVFVHLKIFIYRMHVSVCECGHACSMAHGRQGTSFRTLFFCFVETGLFCSLFFFYRMHTLGQLTHERPGCPPVPISRLAVEMPRWTESQPHLAFHVGSGFDFRS